MANFDSYKISYYSGRPLAAIATCLQGPNVVGRIRFYEDDATLPDDMEEASGAIRLHYPLSRFNEVITTLREEKPLRITLPTVGPSGWVGTGEKEPVGEEES